MRRPYTFDYYLHISNFSNYVYKENILLLPYKSLLCLVGPKRARCPQKLATKQSKDS